MSKKVKIGNVVIGGGERIAVQSMITTKPSDIENSIKAINDLENAGCDIVRFSVLNEEDAKAIKFIKKETKVPLVADIHFDYKLAIKSVENGVDKIRINPGNIGSESNVSELAKVIKEYGVPVRVGANTGSIDKEFLLKYGKNEYTLVESALKNVAILEKQGVNNIVISVKASDVPLMVKSYELLSKKTDYPLHLGVTEAGVLYDGIIANSIGIGSLLLKGIGDTVRVSLSADPIEEVKAAKTILSSLGLKNEGIKVIACPTCGRCEWDCMAFANYIHDKYCNVKKPIKVAIMGCVVNGPGEAADADLGIAGGKENCVIFKNGVILRSVKTENAKEEFIKELDRCVE